MRYFFFRIIVATLFATGIQAQTKVEGYVFEDNNRGYLNMVHLQFKNQQTKESIDVFTNLDGYFELTLAPGQYSLTAKKDLFYPYTKTINVQGAKIFENIKLEREPGYIFDVTLARVRDSVDAPTDAIKGAWIEIYNNTTKEEVLNLKDYPHPNFQFTFTKGNYYTVMIRKKGYFTKRLEAHVDIDGCILCFEGIGDLRPSVTDNLTEGNEMGTLLANIEMIPAEPGDKITLRNIYYDYNSAEIRPDAEIELNKLIPILRDNPSIIIELSSHTDSRGDNAYNQELSFRRAKNAVEYLIAIGGIEARRIIAKGYGENQPVNRCVDGVNCTEEEYQENRRTELKVLGYLSDDPLANKTLVMIKEEEAVARLLEEVQNQEIIEIKEGEELPDEIKKTLNQEEDDKIEGSEKLKGQDLESEYSPELPNHNNVKKIIEKAKENSKNGRHQMLPTDYTGFLIQIFVSSQLIEQDHPIYDYGLQIIVEKTQNGFAYLIGNFETREAAKSYLDDKVKSEFADAFIIKYINGKRS